MSSEPDDESNAVGEGNASAEDLGGAVADAATDAAKGVLKQNIPEEALWPATPGPDGRPMPRIPNDTFVDEIDEVDGTATTPPRVIR